jgi:DNA polymerase
MVPALAKTDEGFLALQEHDNPLVAAAAMARLEAKSTLLETRIQAFLTAGSYCGGKLPVPIRYYGAHTGRDSGEQYNPQNLPRINRDKDGKPVPKLTNALRMSLCAPDGYKVIVADLSGIELRVNHFLWRVASSMKLFRDSPDKADLYKDFASKMYQVLVEEVSKQQRQVGKVAHLGLGFGAAAKTFKAVAKTMGGVVLSEQEAMGVVQSWRSTYQEIVDGWQLCQDALLDITSGRENAIDSWGLLTTCAEGIRLPSGRMIRYPMLRTQKVQDGPRQGRDEWVYGEGRNLRRIYGGRICENVVQALAADALMDNSIKMFKQTGYRPTLRVHDELVYVVPEDNAEELLGDLQAIMRTPPVWWPELIVWSEGDVAANYGAAK